MIPEYKTYNKGPHLVMSADSSSAGSRNVDLENLQAKNHWRLNTEQATGGNKRKSASRLIPVML